MLGHFNIMNNSEGKIKKTETHIHKKKIYGNAREVVKRCEGGGSPRSKEETLPAAPLVLKALKEEQQVFWLLGKKSQKKEKKRPRGHRLKGLRTLKY